MDNNSIMNEEKTVDWIKAALLNRDKESLELIDNIVANITKLQQLDSNKSTNINWWWVIILLLFSSWGGGSFGNWGSDVTKEEDNGNTSN